MENQIDLNHLDQVKSVSSAFGLSPTQTRE